MKNKKILSRAVSSFLLCVGIFMQFPAVFAAGQVTLTVKNPDPYLGNHSWFIYQKVGGETIDDIAILKNFGDADETVNIYAVDATSSDSGSFILKFAGEEQKSIGSWTDVKIKTMTIKPNESVEVPFRITVPKEITPGQYIGGLVVENGVENTTVNNGGPQACEENKLCGGNISVKTRIGSRIYLTVPGEAIEDIQLKSFTAEKTITGATKFEFEIENNGSITYEPKAVIDVYDSMGKPYDRIEKTLGTSFPQTTIKPVMKMMKRPLIGNFTAKATVAFDRKFISENLHGSSLAETRSVSFWVMPWEILFAVLFVILCGVGMHTKRKLAERDYHKNGEKYEIQPNEDLVSIAKERGIAWKKIAKYNKLKAPYVVKPGDTIEVPKKK